ncbi:MAG TPA: universal stress protein [Longimicrobiales bacterium]|nr:universal stress protein [Longimicrobiales bacterium]
MKVDTVLVGLDFSPASLAAAEWGQRNLPARTRFVLHHTIPVVRPPAFLRHLLPDSAGAPLPRREAAERRLEELADSLPEGEVRTEVTVGRAAEEITETARRVGADLILLGPHGQRYTPWDALGSTAEQVVCCSNVPVLIVRGLTENGVGSILVGLDESSTDRVVAWAAYLSRQLGAKLQFLLVLDLGLYGAAGAAGSPDALDALQGAATEAACAWLTARVESAGLDRDAFEAHVTFGQPKFEIVRAAEEHAADLIVMGNPGPGEVTPAHLGGVAGSVIRGSTLPVLIVPGA